MGTDIWLASTQWLLIAAVLAHFWNLFEIILRLAEECGKSAEIVGMLTIRKLN